MALVTLHKDNGLLFLITFKPFQCFFNPSYAEPLERDGFVCLLYKTIYCGAVVLANPVSCCLFKSFHMTEPFRELV